MGAWAPSHAATRQRTCHNGERTTQGAKLEPGGLGDKRGDRSTGGHGSGSLRLLVLRSRLLLVLLALPATCRWGGCRGGGGELHKQRTRDTPMQAGARHTSEHRRGTARRILDGTPACVQSKIHKVMLCRCPPWGLARRCSCMSEI